MAAHLEDPSYLVMLAFFLSRWSSNSSSPVGRAILPLPLVEQFFLTLMLQVSNSSSHFRK